MYYSHRIQRHKLVKYGGSLAFGRWRQEDPKFTARMVRQGVLDCTVLHNKIMSKNLLVLVFFFSLSLLFLCIFLSCFLFPLFVPPSSLPCGSV